ncbi:MAG: protein translocase subunit SecD [Mycolicibacterium sp.]|nr:protein translocase subunit SecD [Mycolicibacterium sp.]
MATAKTTVHPYRWLALFLVLLIGLYLLVFLTGDKQGKPKLGIDLQGGTRVTLTARTADGSKPSPDALKQAQQIIETRVNGLGVSGSEVVIDGENLVITVPGPDGREAQNLGQTAKLYIRPVVQSYPVTPQEQPQGEGAPAGTPSGEPAAPAGQPAAPAAPAEQPTAPAAPVAPAEQPAAPAAPAAPSAQPRPYPLDPAPTPTPNPEPAAPAPAAPAAGAPTAAPAPGAPATPEMPDPRKSRAELIQQYKQLRQSTNPLTLYLAAQVTAQLCGHDDPLAGNDDPALPLVTCSQDGKTVYVLKPSIISGEDIADASSGLDQQSSQYVVNLKFKGAAVDVWGDFTAANPGTQTAFVLDSQVVSAPAIREAIRGGNTQISGSFTATTAKELANVLKYGSLPLSFEASQAENVSASLGMYALRAGLIAGAVGLALVLLYSLLYYRALGLLVAVSLVASGAMVYAILVLLGRHIGYTLDLAGIAGLIIGIGMTADSFVVFFERIKDEIREGRSFRSAVPRGWARARKTIVSGNAVTFIAAAVLYVLAIGQVKGFAFTLGLTTILDVLVVFLVTWPLVYLASKTQIFAKPALNGLGALQQVARERRADAATGRR